MQEKWIDGFKGASIMKKTCAKILIMALVLQSVYLTVNVTNESAKAATLNLHNPTMINGVST